MVKHYLNKVLTNEHLYNTDTHSEVHVDIAICGLPEQLNSQRQYLVN